MSKEFLKFGIDLGTASCGWAVIEDPENGSGEILDLGSWAFDAPETAKERTPTNQLRRQHRGLRRVLRRRRQRMAELRRLFADLGLLPTDSSSALRVAGLDPWTLRAEGLDRPLTGPELAVALGHIAKHRGFKSNSKRDRGANVANDASKMLGAIAQTSERLAQWRTVGEMFARDQEFAGRKRNRDGQFNRSILRDDQAREVAFLFAQQRRAGNKLASEALEDAFAAIAFHQRPLQDSEDRVRPCLFEPGEKRAARRAPSFERFRLLSRLAAIRLVVGDEEVPLGAPAIAQIEAGFGQRKKISFASIRKLLGVGSGIRFAGIAPADEGQDCVARNGNAAEGTASLRDIVIDGAGELAWLALLHRPVILDAIAGVLTFREDLESIRKGLQAFDLDPVVLEAIFDGVQAGRPFAAFTGTGHISSKACRAIIPFLREGLVYSDACMRAGYDHAARPRTNIDEIGNPVAQKALREALKQISALVQKFGVPATMHVELARDVGKSPGERDEIRHGIEQRNRQKERLRAQFLQDVGVDVSSSDDLLRFELWLEQRGRCFYSDKVISPNAIIASDRTIEVDHILPWSRSGDDSFVNKALCFTTMNQDKRGRTPYEWLGSDTVKWAEFSARVEGCLGMKGRKKRNYLLRDGKLLEEKFKPRNLNDTRYACRMLADELKHVYYEGKPGHVFARPGPLTDRLRRAWGIQGLKKGADGKRVPDDRHHALDALIVAATTNSALQRFTLMIQAAEARGDRRDFSGFPPPWPGFAAEASRLYENIFVARAERRRARGEGHAATIRSIVSTEEGPVVYERLAVDKLKLADLSRIKDADRNVRLVSALRDWIEEGCPKDRLPCSPKGDVVRKVALKTNKKVDVLVRDGAAERGEMTRVDVFRKQNRRAKWEFYMVPIYPHQVSDKAGWPAPPNQAIQANTAEADWMQIDAGYEFCWSLYPLSFIEVVKTDGEVIAGYSRGVSRSTGALLISPATTLQEARAGIGTRTLLSFKKFQVDRLGGKHEIQREKRTWHGVVCT